MANEQQSPPAPPAAPPVGTTYADSGGGGGHSVQVTRNVPPKRVQVVPGHEIVYAGRKYTEQDEPFLIGEGAVADQLAFDGHVVVTSHEEVDAWNGDEGQATRDRGLAWVQASEAAFQSSDAHAAFLSGESSPDEYGKALKAAHAKAKPTHDHGFATYDHADKDSAIPVDLTAHRQQLGQQHMLEGRQADDADFQPGTKEA